MIKKIINSLKSEFKVDGQVRYILEDVNTGKQFISKWHKNAFTTKGKEAIARRLAGISLYSNEGLITYGAVGTGVAGGASATTLTSELIRTVISYGNYASNVATIRTFFSTSQANGSLTEYGLFGEEAAAGSDTGTLFEIVAINITKDSSKTLTIESQFTIG